MLRRIVVLGRIAVGIEKDCSRYLYHWLVSEQVNIPLISIGLVYFPGGEFSFSQENKVFGFMCDWQCYLFWPWIITGYTSLEAFLFIHGCDGKPRTHHNLQILPFVPWAIF